MKEPEKFTPDDAEIAELLQSVGARQEPSAHMMQEVEAAVRAEWLSVVAGQRRRRALVWGVAASLCAVAVGAAVSLQFVGEAEQPFATLQRTEGDVFVTSDDRHWIRMEAGQRISVGDSIRSDGRAALRLDSGASLRLDRATSAHVKDDDRLVLNVGALYIDSGSPDRANSLTISTYAGSVRHIGTQYQIRTRDDGIDVSVREGRVLVDSQSGRSFASAGELLTVSAQGGVLHAKVSPTDQQWRWAIDAAPAFVIENASLTSFLDWVARESGRPLVYESARAKSVAADEILHGSVEGLTLEVALSAVLATTPFRLDEGTPENIKIGFAATVAPDATHHSVP